jgi:hypothetical protein
MKTFDLSIFEKRNKTNESKLEYKRRWYRENAEKKGISDYNKRYYQEHKNELLRKRKLSR